MATRSVLLPVLIAVLLGLAERPARAIALDDGCINDPVCRQHYDTALELFQDGRYEAALELRAVGQPVDVVTVGSWLKGRGRIEQVGGMGYLTEILNSAPAVANVTNGHGGLPQPVVFLVWNARTDTYFIATPPFLPTLPKTGAKASGGSGS